MQQLHGLPSSACNSRPQIRVAGRHTRGVCETSIEAVQVLIWHLTLQDARDRQSCLPQIACIYQSAKQRLGLIQSGT